MAACVVQDEVRAKCLLQSGAEGGSAKGKGPIQPPHVLHAALLRLDAALRPSPHKLAEAIRQLKRCVLGAPEVGGLWCGPCLHRTRGQTN